MIGRRVILAAAFALVAAASISRSEAEDAASYPSHPVKIVVSTPPGSQQDTLGRLLADSLGKSTGQSFIVENVPGAGSIASAVEVAKAPADGYTILVANAAPLGIASALRSDLPYNATTAFAPVSQLTSSYFMVVVNPQTLAVKNLQDLLTLLKASPNKYTFASSGVGGIVHMQSELFMLRTGTEMTHVPFKSTGEVTTALLGGYVDVAVDTTDALPMVQSGQLKALAVTSARRAPELPDVPTMQELSPGYGTAQVWQGVFVPAATPAPIIAKLNQIVVSFVKAPDTAAHFHNLGLTPASSTPSEFAQLVASDAATWADVIRANKISTQ